LKMKGGAMCKKYVKSFVSYGAECWAMKVEDVKRMKSTEMRMLRMICGRTVRDKVRNEEIRERTEVESIEEHLREIIGIHLFVKVPRPGDSKGTFWIFESSCHLLLPV